MALTQFRRIKTDDNDLRQLQDAAGFVFQDLLSKGILDGQLIVGISINGTKIINHNLGRKLQGYIVILNSANVSIWDSQSTNAMENRTLVLNSSGATTISLWVF